MNFDSCSGGGSTTDLITLTDGGSKWSITNQGYQEIYSLHRSSGRRIRHGIRADGECQK